MNKMEGLKYGLITSFMFLGFIWCIAKIVEFNLWIAAFIALTIVITIVLE